MSNLISEKEIVKELIKQFISWEIKPTKIQILISNGNEISEFYGTERFTATINKVKILSWDVKDYIDDYKNKTHKEITNLLAEFVRKKFYKMSKKGRVVLLKQMPIEEIERLFWFSSEYFTRAKLFHLTRDEEPLPF